MLILKHRTLHILNMAYTAHRNDCPLGLASYSRFFDEARELVELGFLTECCYKECGWVTDLTQYAITDAGISFVEGTR